MATPTTRSARLRRGRQLAPEVLFPGPLQARTAALLPGLALARVDGKSPVEYLREPERETDEPLRAREQVAFGREHS